MKKDLEYIPLWEFKVSPRATIVISRMIDPKHEKEFFLKEEYLKKMETKDEYAIESQKRLKVKKDNEKFYINSIIINYDQELFRTKGLSIYRSQLPELINTLKDIKNGIFDTLVNKILIEAGIIQKTHDNNIFKNTLEKNSTLSYHQWLKTLSAEQQEEVKHLSDSGWTIFEIQKAFDAKYAKT